MIPDAATVIGGVDLKALVNSDAFKKGEETMMQGEAKQAMEAFEACKLGKDKWKSLVFGLDPSDAKSKRAMAIAVDGVGVKENLECIHDKMKEIDEGEDPWTMEEKDGRLELAMKDGGTGWVVNENLVAFAGEGWKDAVKELVEGKGKSAIDNSLKDLVGKTDTSKAVWGAGKVPAEMAKGPGEGITDVAGWIDLSSGVSVQVTGGFGSEETAKTKAEGFNKQFEGAKGAAKMFNIPETVVNSVKIEQKGDAVQVTGAVSKEDLDKIVEVGKKAMGGGGPPG